MTSVISSGHLESPRDFDVFRLSFYRCRSVEFLCQAAACVSLEDRLLSGRSQVQLLSGAPNSRRPICNSQLSSVILGPMKLTHDRVHIIRTAGKSDRHFERLWRIGAQAIRDARVGNTWKDHPTPVDDKPRVHAGSWGDLPDNGPADSP